MLYADYNDHSLAIMCKGWAAEAFRGIDDIAQWRDYTDQRDAISCGPCGSCGGSGKEIARAVTDETDIHSTALNTCQTCCGTGKDESRSWPECSTCFYDRTNAIAAKLIAISPKLDPDSVVKIHEIVNRWYTSHSAEGIPSDDELNRLRDRAGILLNTIMADIHSRMVDEKTKSVSQPPDGGSPKTTPLQSETDVEELGDFRFYPGGYSLRGVHDDLKGRPLAALRQFANIITHRRSEPELQSTVWADSPTTPNNVAVNVGKARSSLRSVLARLGTPSRDPIPVLRGCRETTWELRLPNINP